MRAWRNGIQLSITTVPVFKPRRPNNRFVGSECSMRMTCERPPTRSSTIQPKLFQVRQPSPFDALPSRQMSRVTVNHRSEAAETKVTTTTIRLSTTLISRNIYRRPPDWCQSRWMISISRMNWHASMIYFWVIRMRSFFTMTPIFIPQQITRTATRMTTTTSQPKSTSTSRMTLMIFIITTMIFHFHHHLFFLTIHSQIIIQYCRQTLCNIHPIIERIISLLSDPLPWTIVHHRPSIFPAGKIRWQQGSYWIFAVIYYWIPHSMQRKFFPSIFSETCQSIYPFSHFV